MNLAVALHELQKARRYVKEGRTSMQRQREMVARLERRGRDTLEAILFLESLEEMQDHYMAHRDRLEAQVLKLVRPSDEDA